MTTTPVWENAGFEYDEGDTSVGIWPGWVHWCVEDGSVDIAEGWAFDHFEGEGVDRYAVGQKSLVCNGCGANISWTEQDWEPDIEEPGGSDDYTTDPF